MSQPSDDRYRDGEHLRRYLLGDLSESEAAALETAYFGDPTLLARLELAEHDLLDDYASGRLPQADREKLERTVLATRDGRMELALARALRPVPDVQSSAAAFDRPARRAPRTRWLAAAAAVALAAGGLSMVWWLRDDVTVPSQSASAPAATPAAPAGAPPSTAADFPATPAVVATLLLTRDLSRSEGRPPTLIASAATTHVELQVPDVLPPASVRARIETAEGKAVWSGPLDLAADRRARVRVPAPVLGLGDYVLTVASKDGTPADAATAYYFRVRAR
jgi:hypothetical protein